MSSIEKIDDQAMLDLLLCNERGEPLYPEDAEVKNAAEYQEVRDVADFCKRRVVTRANIPEPEPAPMSPAPPPPKGR